MLIGVHWFYRYFIDTDCGRVISCKATKACIYNYWLPNTRGAYYTVTYTQFIYR